MSTNLLFGVAPSIYQNPFGAAAALRWPPYNGLGAELLAVGESIQQIDREVGDAFTKVADHYRMALGNNDEAQTRIQKSRLASLVRGMPEEKWSQTIGRLPNWAVSGDFFATRRIRLWTNDLKEIERVERIEALWEPYQDYPAVRNFFPLFFGEDVTPLATDEGAVEFLKRFVEETGEENSAKAFANFPDIRFMRGLCRGAQDQLAYRLQNPIDSDHEKEIIKSIEDELRTVAGKILQMPEFLLELAKITGPHVGEAFAALKSFICPNGFQSQSMKVLLLLAKKVGPRVGEVFLMLPEMPSDKANSVDRILDHLEAMEKERLEAEIAEVAALEENSSEENSLFNETELREKSDQELENIIDSMGREGPDQLFGEGLASYYHVFNPDYFPVLEELRRRGEHGRIASVLTSLPFVSQHHVIGMGANSFSRPCKRTVYEFIRNHFDEFKTDTGVLAFFALRSDEDEEEKLELLARQGAWDPLDDVRSDSGGQQSKRHRARDILDREIDRIETSKILLTIGAFGANVESRLKAVAKLEILGRTREGSKRNLNSIATGEGVGEAWSRYKNDAVIAAAKAALERLSQEGGNNG